MLSCCYFMRNSCKGLPDSRIFINKTAILRIFKGPCQMASTMLLYTTIFIFELVILFLSLLTCIDPEFS